MTGRQRLPDRRRHDVAEIEHGGFKLIVGIGRYGDGKLAELFVDTHKTGTAIDTLLKDSAVLLSLALQHGASTDTIRHALSRTGPLAAVLDHIGDDSS
jgi:ribonucleoside-diphosphate reductase alpha chain